MANVPLSFSGQVIHGKGRGRELGFPTANIAVEEDGREILPRGVFAATVQYHEDEESFALVNIGTRPTFGEINLVVELHLFDFTGDLYGQRLKFILIKKIRDERAFANIEALKEQINHDIHQARLLFAQQEKGYTQHP